MEYLGVITVLTYVVVFFALLKCLDLPNNRQIHFKSLESTFHYSGTSLKGHL